MSEKESLLSLSELFQIVAHIPVERTYFPSQSIHWQDKMMYIKVLKTIKLIDLFIYLFIYLFGANKRKNILQMILFECMDHETICFLQKEFSENL